MKALTASLVAPGARRRTLADFGGLVMPMCYAQVNSSRVYEGCDPNGSNA